MIRLSPTARGLLLLAAATVAAPTTAQARPQDTAAPQVVELAARCQGAHVTFDELDDMVLTRHVQSRVGRETRLFLLKLRVVESVGRELGVQATVEEVQAMLEDIERGIRQEGAARDMDEYLAQKGVSKEEFLASLRAAVLQTKLARLGLGIPAGEPITAEQQELWLEARIQERGLEELPAPWEGGTMLRCGDVTIEREQFVPYLRERLPEEDVRGMLLDALRAKRLAARMPDLDPEVTRVAVEEELQRRRVEVQQDPRYKGVPYEQLLQSEGVLLERWPEDPSVVVAALSHLWMRRTYQAEDLRAAYENERDWFDAQFGEALEAHVLFLHASDRPNELIPLDHEAAEKQLLEVASGIRSFEDFQLAVELRSQDRASRERKGYLGWVTRTGTSGPSPARGALFEALDSGAYKPTLPADSPQRLVGPVRTERGVLLLWVGQRRPRPTWDEMVVHVHRTLRQRFIDEAVDPAQVLMYLDEE